MASFTGGITDANNTDHRYAQIIREETGRALWAANVCEKFCFRDSIETEGGSSWQRNVQATNAAAVNLAETDDLGNTQLDHTLVTIATGEVGAMTTISKWLQMNQVGRMRDVIYWAEQLGKSMAKKIDTDITALFSALNGGVVVGGGSTDTDIVSALEEANFTLENNDAFVGLGHNPVGVLHPRTVSYLRKQIYGTPNVIYSDFSSKEGIYADANGWVGEFAGIDLWQTTNVAEINEAGLISKLNAVFVPDKTLGFIENYGLTPFTDADASLRATEVGILRAYGVGELEDKSGVCVKTKAA